jgi:hypothetical protein
LTAHGRSEACEQCWHVYLGDMQAGMIAKRITSSAFVLST